MCKHCQATTSKEEMSSGRIQRSYSSRNARPWPCSLHSHAEPRPHMQRGCQLDPLEQPVGPHIHVKAPNKGSFLHKTVIFLLASRTAARPTINHTVVTAYTEHIFKTNLCRNVHEYYDCMKQHKHTNSSTQQHPAQCRESLSEQPEAPGGNPLTLCHPPPSSEGWATLPPRCTHLSTATAVTAAARPTYGTSKVSKK